MKQLRLLLWKKIGIKYSHLCGNTPPDQEPIAVGHDSRNM